MGIRKWDISQSSLQNNLIQDSEGNEESGYPVPDSTKQRHMTPRNPKMSKKHSQRRNSASNH
jgi:hypothetical protein